MRGSSGIKQLLETLSTISPKGPAPAFKPQHLLYALLILGERGPLGRKRLSESMGLGEGSIRTVLQRLRRLGLVSMSRGGYGLSEVGRELYDALSSQLFGPRLVGFELPIKARHAAGVVVRGLGEAVRSGVEERDAAVKAGADAALIFIFRDGKLLMPPESNITSEQPKLAEDISREFKPGEEDVIIIAGAEDPQTASYAALAAGLTLLQAGKLT